MADFWAFMSSSNAVTMFIVLAVFVLALYGKITSEHIAGIFGGIVGFFISKKA